MNSTSLLTSSHQRTYDRIFQHPISHNLEWHDVRSLLEKLGEVVQEHNGNLTVTRNGQKLILHAPRTKDVAEMDEVMTLRHFLKSTETAEPPAAGEEIHWLLVIDHHKARIFHAEMHDSNPQRILQYGAKEYFRHTKDSKATSRGQEKPDPNTFFEPVVKGLRSRGPILIFGTGTGASSEMEQFTTWLTAHHPDVAERVVGSVVVDEHHLSEGQLLEQAWRFFAAAVVPEGKAA